MTARSVALLALALAACDGREGAPEPAPAAAVAPSPHAASSASALALSAPPDSASPAAALAPSTAPTVAQVVALAAEVSPLAGLFAGPPDPAVKLTRTYEQFQGEYLMMRKPPGWSLVTKRTLGFWLQSPDATARLYVGDAPKGAKLIGPAPDQMPYTSAREVKVSLPVNGAIGVFSLPAQVGEGTALIAGDTKDRSRLYYFQVEVGGTSDVSALLVLRPSVKPETEKAMIAAIRSMKRPTDREPAAATPP